MIYEESPKRVEPLTRNPLLQVGSRCAFAHRSPVAKKPAMAGVSVANKIRQHLTQSVRHLDRPDRSLCLWRILLTTSPQSASYVNRGQRRIEGYMWAIRVIKSNAQRLVYAQPARSQTGIKAAILLVGTGDGLFDFFAGNCGCVLLAWIHGREVNKFRTPRSGEQRQAVFVSYRRDNLFYDRYNFIHRFCAE